MKPLFTIHEGEFLVGDYINRKLAKRFDVWVPTKDMLAHGLRRLPVVDDDSRVTGFVDESAIARAYLRGNTA